MTTKTYNPYNAVKKIVDLKGDYHTAKELGGDYKQYQTAAAQYYDELAKNGRQDIADKLATSDYTKAKDILAEYKEDTTVDDFYSELAKVGTGDKSPISEQQSSYIDDLMGISKGSNGGKTTNQLSEWLADIADLSTGKTSPKTSDAVSKLMDSWSVNNQTHTDLTNDYHQTGKDQLDRINTFDYTKQSYFQPIMDSYKLQGDNAANGELASGAAANGGNIDSYAAANANRQQLAFTNAGHQAALAAAQQNQDNWLDLYGLMGGNIANYGNTNAQNLGNIADMYSTDALERQNATNALYGVFNNAYNTDATERGKAMDVLQQLFGNESEERKHAATAMIDKYLADLGLESTRYTTDSDERKNAVDNETEVRKAELEKLQKEHDALMGYNSDLAKYEADKYSADKTYDAAKYKADMEKTIKELGLQDTQETAKSETKAETETRKAREDGVQELYSVLSELVNAMRDGQYEDIQSVDDIRREIKNWSGYSTAYDPIIQSYLNGYERKFGTTT